MDLPIYSVKANSQAGNKWVYVMTTQKGQSRKILSLGSKTFAHFAGKFNRGLRVQERGLMKLHL